MSLSLRYRDVFYHKVLRPSKLWALLEDLDSRISESNGDDSVSEDVEALKTAIGDESTEGTILARLKALEDAQ